MNLKEAISEIEAAFGPADKSSPPTSKTMVTSGGVQNDPRDTPIALYISREAAIAAWAREVENFLDSKPFRSYQFVGEIDVDRWNITVQDKHSQHRCAEPRFVVVATIGVEWVRSEQVTEDSAALTN